MADPSATPEVGDVGRDGGGGERPAGRGRARLLAVVANVLVLAFLDWAQVALMPLAFGVFLAVLLWPFQVWLERRMPRRLAYLISVLVLLAVLAGFASALVWSGQKVVEGAPQYAERLQEMASAARDWAAARGLSLPADGVSAEATQGLARRALVAVYSSLSAIVLILAFAILALLEGHAFRAKAQSAFRHQRHARSVAAAAGRIVVRFQQYLWARTVVAIVQGVSAWLVALVLGLDLAVLWGLIAFLLNHVPSLGSILAVIPPSLFALIQFDGWQRPLVVLLAMSLLQILLGNFVDPKIEGRFLALCRWWCSSRSSSGAGCGASPGRSSGYRSWWRWSSSSTTSPPPAGSPPCSPASRGGAAAGSARPSAEPPLVRDPPARERVGSQSYSSVARPVLATGI